MIKYALFIILCIPDVQVSGYDPYFITEKKTTWRQAKDVCDIAMNLNLNVSSKDFVVDVGHGMELEDDVWVGLYIKKTGFEFIGCAGKPDRKADVISVQNTPGLCYSECSDTDVVGLRGNECYCLSDEPDKITGECTWSCPQNDWMSCGGKNEQSVYRHNSAVSVDDPERKSHCLRYAHYNPGGTVKWEECSTRHPPLCMKGNTAKPLVVPEQLQWNISIQPCNKHPLRPSHYKDLGGINETVLPSWTGIIRSDVLYTNKDIEGHVNIRYGYLTKDPETSQTVLAFTNSKDVVKFTLCQNEQHIEQNSSDNSSSSIGLAVGLSIAILVVVIIAVLAVVFLKRRKNIPSFCKKRAHCKEPDNNVKHDASAGSSNVNMNFRQLGRLDNSMKGENNVGRNDEIDYAGTYDVLEQPENETYTYNMTMSQNRSSSEKENNYNSIRLDTNNTYDHAHKGKNARHKSEDDYDVTEIAAMKLNTNAGLDEFKDIDNDAYNHIDLKPKKSNITDNVYSAPWQQNRSTGDPFSNTTNDIQDEEDTYNHINEQNTKKIN